MANEPIEGAPFLHHLTQQDLLERAVRNARSRKHGRTKHPRWVGVSDAFALGSTYSHDLCKKFNLDPHEEVKR